MQKDINHPQLPEPNIRKVADSALQHPVQERQPSYHTFQNPPQPQHKDLVLVQLTERMKDLMQVHQN